MLASHDLQYKNFLIWLNGLFQFTYCKSVSRGHFGVDVLQLSLICKILSMILIPSMRTVLMHILLVKMHL